MPNRQLLQFIGIGLAIVAVMIGGFLYVNRGAHIRLAGSIQKVRTQALDDNSTVLIADFRFVNPADYPFIVRTVQVTLEDDAGQVHESMLVSDGDAKRMFEYYPLLGAKYNESLRMRDKVAPREGMDRMIAVRFELPEPKVKSRQKLRIRIEDVDGAVSVIEDEKQG